MWWLIGFLLFSLVYWVITYIAYTEEGKDILFLLSVGYVIGLLYIVMIYFIVNIDPDLTTDEHLAKLNAWHRECNDIELSIMIGEALKDDILRRSEYDKIYDFRSKISIKSKETETKKKISLLKKDVTEKITDFIRTE